MNNNDALRFVEIMLRANNLEVVAAVVEAKVIQHNAKPTVPSQIFLEAVAAKCPAMVHVA